MFFFNINKILGCLNKEIQIVEKTKNNKHDKVQIKYLNGDGSIREELGEHNTLTV